MQLDYWQLFIKFGLGLLTLIVQINLFGKSNLAPTTALDQLQNYPVEKSRRTHCTRRNENI